MITNLELYSKWKRSTLDRLTDIYRRAFTRILMNHLTLYRSNIEEALDAGSTTFNFLAHDLEEKLLHILNTHQQHVVKTAVSDGIREISPDKKLSTWEKWPHWYPVEDTFINLEERKKRDNIFDYINKKIFHKSQAIKKQTVRVQIDKYLSNVQGLFKEVAKQYYGDEENETSRDAFKDLFKFVFKKTDNQAEVIFRTETTRYFNDARLDYFQDNTDVDFIQLVAVTDGRISAICESRDMYVVPLSHAQDKQFKPPFHPNCRTIQSPLDTDLSSDVEEVRKNLGREFGKVQSFTSDKAFIGKRAPPSVPLPKGW